MDQEVRTWVNEMKRHLVKVSFTRQGLPAKIVVPKVMYDKLVAQAEEWERHHFGIMPDPSAPLLFQNIPVVCADEGFPEPDLVVDKGSAACH